MTLPYYPFYWGDYSAKTYNLTVTQHGVYMLLLRHIYVEQTRIPDEKRYEICKAFSEEEKRNVDEVLAIYFLKKDGKWRNDRAFEVIEQQHKIHQANVLKGKKGGRPAKAQLNPNLSPDKVGPKQPEPEPNIRIRDMSETSSDVINFPKPKRKRNDYPEDFERFYSAYPSDPGMSKPEALKQWGKLSEQDKASAVEALPAFIAWVADQGRDYRTVHACRYISQRRFEGFIDREIEIRNFPPIQQQVFVKSGTDAWDAWQSIKKTPVNQHGGWYFPSEFPPREFAELKLVE